MSSFALITGGTLLVLIASYDFLRTAISLSGMGFVSGTIARKLWALGSSVGSALERRTGLSLRGLMGPTILIVIAVTWVVMYLLGYALIFRGGLSLVETETGQPATWIQTAAFVGSRLSTLGATTVKVTDGWWDFLSVVVAVNGMVVLTLSVSFLLSILQTTNSARTFACRFRALQDQGLEGEASGHIEGLGRDLSGVVVMLAASPLPGVFVPTDPRMDFPSAVMELCDLAKDGTLSETSELVAALRLLGRHLGDASEDNELAAARAWAQYYTIVRT